MYSKVFSRSRVILLLLLIVLAVFLTGHVLVSAPTILALQNSVSVAPVAHSTRLLNGKTASLSWITGSDCQAGIRAYLATAAADPDAALVGTGWVDPTSGQLSNGQSNKCTPGSYSMDNVIQLIHSKGGVAYLTITMQTDGTAYAWTPQQAAAYIDKATTNPNYITPIVHEVMRGNYDGVIMDLEGVDNTYPSIQQLFARYNQQVWAAMQRLHKWYGIALLHKLSDRDEYYYINGFENWRLLAHAADFIVIMAVDQSYWTPGPSVGIPWLTQLLAYALQTMPNMLSHIIWELPLYGNIWHQEGGKWVFDGIITYAEAQALVSQVTPAQIDVAASNLHDPYAPHIVYTDTSGVKQSLWYLTSQSLYNVITGFWQTLAQEPQFANSRLQIAVWWRTTSEPMDFWARLDTLY